MSVSHKSKEIRASRAHVGKHASDHVVRQPAPDKAKLTPRQIERLSQLTGVSQAEFEKGTVAEIAEKLKFVVDPSLFRYQRVTGRVIKLDGSGNEYPVPGATVHVEDTDASFLGFFPVEGAYSWFLPLSSHREEITTAKTDECGRFTAFVPRFEIDWVLHWRHERYCYSDMFLKPNIREVLEGLHPEEGVHVPPHGPGPDPGPERVVLSAGGMGFARAEQLIGRASAARLGALEHALQFGSAPGELEEMLERSAFGPNRTPPLPERIRDMEAKQAMAHVTSAPRAGAKREISAEAIESAGLRWIGPFVRCVDVLVPEIAPILDVPDITFRVTQDVDADGDEEQIYSEGYFDVRWNATSLPEVTLVASDIALAGIVCRFPEVPCQTPGIAAAGLMPLLNAAAPAEPYFDAASGYARRVNRPHPSGLEADAGPLPRALAPFTGTLQLYGCPHKAGAQYYRVLYGNGPDMVPFMNTWKVYRFVGSPLHIELHDVVPDAHGWYPILGEADGWMPGHLLMNWPTGASGLFHVQLQLGNASKSPIDTTAPIGMRVDNTDPVAQFTGLAWRAVGDSTWNEFPHLTCPVVRRPAGRDIEFRVDYAASATHLRDTVLAATGCGGGSPTLFGPIDQAEHWHQSTSDNSVARSAIYRLSASAPPGAYGFHVRAASRAFNPAGGDGGFEADWEYNPVYRWTPADLPVAVVDVAPTLVAPMP